MKLLRPLKHIYFSLAVWLGSGMLNLALAQGLSDGGTPIRYVTAKATSALFNIEVLSYALAAFPIFAVGVLAYFGKFNWGWLISIMCCLAMIASIPEIIIFFTGQEPY